MARPSDYSDEIAGTICERIADGESLRSICSQEGFPHKATVFRWLASNEAFRDQYAHAREAQAERWSDELLDIADDGTNDYVKRAGERGVQIVADSEHIARSRLRVDTRNWLLSKMLPKKYGERLVHAGDPEHPVNVVTRIERVIVNPADRDAGEA
jgi:hypothetical protein